MCDCQSNKLGSLSISPLRCRGDEPALMCNNRKDKQMLLQCVSSLSDHCVQKLVAEECDKCSVTLIRLVVFWVMQHSGFVKIRGCIMSHALKISFLLEAPCPAKKIEQSDRQQMTLTLVSCMQRCRDRMKQHTAEYQLGNTLCKSLTVLLTYSFQKNECLEKKIGFFCLQVTKLS